MLLFYARRTTIHWLPLFLSINFFPRIAARFSFFSKIRLAAYNIIAKQNMFFAPKNVNSCFAKKKSQKSRNISSLQFFSAALFSSLYFLFNSKLRLLYLSFLPSLSLSAHLTRARFESSPLIIITMIITTIRALIFIFMRVSPRSRKCGDFAVSPAFWRTRKNELRKKRVGRY